MEAPAGIDERKAKSDVGFAPRDLTDARALGEWQSRYEGRAWKFIAVEAVYLTVLLAAVVVALINVWLGGPASWWSLSPDQNVTFTRYSYAWLGGTLGGVFFALKWLYHSVAKQLWNLDRCLWRYFTPHISGGLAFAITAIFNSILASDRGSFMSGTKTLAIGFLVGLFSDNALAKLAEVAETLLGPTRRFSSPKRHHNGSDADH
jgi:hypothetical protein